ncbi:LLM class flavin-dependent oxidoreductase [soil metagenome]
MANGGWILSSNKPVLDGSYEYNRQVALLAESIGLDFIMAMAKWRGYGGVTEHWKYSLESQMLMAALAAETKRVKVWATVHTLLQNPVVAAKMMTTLDHISGGRAGLNIVTGSYKGEFEMMHAWRADVGHDERYDLATEWIQIIKRLWSEPSTTYAGKYFSTTDAESFPKPVSARPFLVCAGTSRRGMEFTVQETDAIFLGGATPEEMGKNSRAAKALAGEYGRTMKTYTMLNLVIGDTDADAEKIAEHYRAGFDEEAFKGMLRAYGMIDTEIGKENAFTAKARSGFMAEHVKGSPATITEKIIALIETADLDGLMLIFPDYLKGMPIFAEQILPKVRAHFPGKVPA